MKAIDVMRATGGRPQLNNDDAIIPALVRCGVPLKEARDYAVDGCQHFTTYARKDHSAWFNLAKVLDLALNNGIDRLTGKQIGLPTGDPGRFTSLDGVISAFQKQLEHCIKMMSTESELVDALIRDMMCLPYASIHVKGCLERGAEVLAGGGYYNWTGMHGTGIATVANSLAAMKKVIFEEKKFSVLELTKALDKNFIGFEELRQDLIQAPKWGNDDDYVDSLAVKVANLFLDEADKHKCRANPANPGPSIAGFHSLTFNEGFGEATAATPDGRKTGERLSDGIAPSVGTYQGGPTAVFLSAAKLDHTRSWTASLTLTLDGSTEVLTDLSRTYLTDMGGKHLMGNLVCPDILLDAKKHPEKYRDMLVRVAGFSARFVELPENMQDLVIRRAPVGV
jgi:formate C-acetyltransferase